MFLALVVIFVRRIKLATCPVLAINQYNKANRLCDRHHYFAFKIFKLNYFISIINHSHTVSLIVRLAPCTTCNVELCGFATGIMHRNRSSFQ